MVLRKRQNFLFLAYDAQVFLDPFHVLLPDRDGALLVQFLVQKADMDAGLESSVDLADTVGGQEQDALVSSRNVRQLLDQQPPADMLLPISPTQAKENGEGTHTVVLQRPQKHCSAFLSATDPRLVRVGTTRWDEPDTMAFRWMSCSVRALRKMLCRIAVVSECCHSINQSVEGEHTRLRRAEGRNPTCGQVGSSSRGSSRPSRPCLRYHRT